MKNNTIKAELWNISICEGALGMSHGQFYNILEVYIPSLDFSFNYANDDIHVFRPCVEVRYIESESAEKVADIKIDSEFANELFRYFEFKGQTEKCVKDFWESDKAIRKYTSKILRERDKRMRQMFKGVKTTGIVKTI